MSPEPHDATWLAARIRAGDLSAVEVVADTLARLEADEHGAVVHLDPSAVDRIPTTGPFAGVPLIAKDLLPWPGMRCAFGSRLFASHVPEAHVPYTQALVDAGFVCVGKSATSELGLLGSTETLLEGVTRNPWGPELSAGGSSGGAVAAVAAGLVPLAHASDGGGSIRGPAALAGLFGFKPSGGRTRLASAPGPMNALVSEHCVSRTVRDSIGFLQATVNEPLGTLGRIQPLRIGFYTTDAFGNPASPEGCAAVERAVAMLGELGHRVEPIEPPPVDGTAASDAFFTLAGAGVAQLRAMMQPMLGRAPGPNELEPFTLALLAGFDGKGPDAADVAGAQLREQGSRMAAFLGSVDVALCPTIGGERPKLGHLAPHLPYDVVLARMRRLAGFTALHNQAGAPAMTLPLHHDPHGHPVGVQFAASPGQDERLLSLALQVEAACGGWNRGPRGG